MIGKMTGGAPQDARRVAPRVDRRGSGAGALAEQVDALIAEGLPGGFGIVDPMGQCVAVEIDAVSLQSFRASGEGYEVCTGRFWGASASPECGWIALRTLVVRWQCRAGETGRCRQRP